MSLAFLVVPPVGDARPEPLSPPVVERAVQARHAEITHWLSPRVPALSGAEINFALAAAIKAGGADGFRATCVVRDKFGWPADMELCGYVRDTCHALAFALRVETRVWVARTGVRFPGKESDAVEWSDESGHRRAGQVIAVNRDYASAVVQPISSLVKAGSPLTVFAEHVSANVTQAKYPAAPVPQIEADQRPKPGMVCPVCNGLGMLNDRPDRPASCCLSCEGSGCL